MLDYFNNHNGAAPVFHQLVGSYASHKTGQLRTLVTCRQEMIRETNTIPLDKIIEDKIIFLKSKKNKYVVRYMGRRMNELIH